jgi:hypothetical protein
LYRRTRARGARACGTAVALFVLCFARGASAQYAEEPAQKGGDLDDRSLVPMVGFNIGGMASFPVGRSSDALDPGGGFAVGVMFRPRPFVGFQFEYSYSWYNIKGDIFKDTRLDGHAGMQYWDLNVIARPVHAKHVGFYVIAGPGIYRRSATITEFTGQVAVGTYCDPWLYFCYPTAAPAEDVIGSRHSTDFGLNGGIGMYFVLSPPLRLYLEARYHYIWGPTFHNMTGKSFDANGKYLPVTLGIAF